MKKLLTSFFTGLLCSLLFVSTASGQSYSERTNQQAVNLVELQTIIQDLLKQVEVLRVKIDALIKERSLSQKMTEDTKKSLPSAPIISGLSISDIEPESVRVRWSTDVLATGFVYFATSTPTTKFAPFGSSMFSTSHDLVLVDLEPGNLYYYLAESAGPEGVSTRTEEGTFRTLDKEF